MRQVLIADLIKAAENEADLAWREEVAESLGVDPEDVDDDDVEYYLSMGRENKGELDSSVGEVSWIYDNTIKAYIIHMVVIGPNKPIDLIYKLDPDMMKEWMNSDSIGEYYNTYIRSNKDIEDPDNSCGCQDEPCSEELIRSYKARYASIS
jgi:hypothetical protein